MQRDGNASDRKKYKGTPRLSRPVRAFQQCNQTRSCHIQLGHGVSKHEKTQISVLPHDRRNFQSRQLINMSSNCLNFNLKMTRRGIWLKTYFLLHNSSFQFLYIVEVFSHTFHLSPGLSHTVTHVQTDQNPELQRYKIAFAAVFFPGLQILRHYSGLPTRLCLCIHSVVHLCFHE